MFCGMAHVTSLTITILVSAEQTMLTQQLSDRSNYKANNFIKTFEIFWNNIKKKVLINYIDVLSERNNGRQVDVRCGGRHRMMESES